MSIQKNRRTGFKFHPKNKWNTHLKTKVLCTLKHYSGLTATITEVPRSMYSNDYFLEIKSIGGNQVIKLPNRNAHFDYTDCIYYYTERYMYMGLKIAGIHIDGFGQGDKYLRVTQFKEKK